MSLHVISLHMNEDHEVDSMGVIASYPFDFTIERAKEAFVLALKDYIDVDEDNIDVLRASKTRTYFFYNHEDAVYQAFLSQEE